GLEEGEIDQGQHDVRRDVLFVTSACILVSRATVERGGSWDPGYFLFGEDLDLCIRARMLGFPVVVAPKAYFYHAVAMATRRRAIQRRRKVSDRRVRRYMVRDLPRARIFLERRLMQWGEETVRLSAKTFANLTPGAIAARLGRWARSASVLTSLAIAFVLLI